MRIIEFDGTSVTFEQLEPKWTIEEVHARHAERVATTCARLGIETRDLWDHPKELLHLSDLLAGDHRERMGMNRVDGKRIENVRRKLPLEKAADMFGIRTCDLGWEQAAIEALKGAPARGQVQGAA